MEEWKKYCLSDIATIVTGKTPSTKNSEFFDGGIHFVTPGDINKGYKHIYSTERTITEAGLLSVKGSTLEPNTICVSCIGNLGYVGMTTMQCVSNQQINSLVVKEGFDPDFIFYLMRSLWPVFKNFEGQSTTLSILNKTLFSKIEVCVPPLEKQKQIAGVLSSLDDKIELNNRINHNLEEQAQALYKSWFVDFEPFKDGKFIESEMGLIPEKLKTTRIEDLEHNIESGRRPKGGIVEVEDGVPSIGAENIKGLGYYDYSKTKYVSREFAESLKKGVIKGYELLIYKDGGKPGYFIPNYSIFGEGFPYDYMTTNEHVFILDFYNPGFNAFSYFFFQTEEVLNYLNAQGGKAAIPGINKNDVESILIYSPENELVQEFGLRVAPLIKAILKRCVENRRLSIIRDTILPDLMSGKIELCKTIC